MIKFTFFSLYLAAALLSCATPKPAEVASPVATTYDFKSVKPVTHPSPLPLQSSIWVDWKRGDEVFMTSEGFRAWDINRDGRFDMLEILSPKGATTAWAYDFNGDGEIDILQATEQAGVALLEGPAPIPNPTDASRLLQLSH